MTIPIINLKSITKKNKIKISLLSATAIMMAVILSAVPMFAFAELDLHSVLVLPRPSFA
jgi:hypothetical protein